MADNTPSHIIRWSTPDGASGATLPRSFENVDGKIVSRNWTPTEIGHEIQGHIESGNTATVEPFGSSKKPAAKAGDAKAAAKPAAEKKPAAKAAAPKADAKPVAKKPAQWGTPVIAKKAAAGLSKAKGAAKPVAKPAAKPAPKKK